MQIRPIDPADDARAAALVREVLTEFGANRPGFAWADPELDALSAAYQENASGYWLCESDGVLAGAGGFQAFHCALPRCAELQKMYFLPAYRGRGWGQALLCYLLDQMQLAGYRYCYLESLSSMTQALNLYEKMGFERLDAPFGDSGHTACDRWYLRSW